MFNLGSLSKIVVLMFLSWLVCAFSFNSLAHGNKLNLAGSCEEKGQVSVHCGKTPSSVFDQDGRLWVVFEFQQALYVSKSENQGQSFSTATKVNSIPESIYTNGENRPKIVLGPEGEIYISWTKKTDGRFTGDIRFSRSTDSGKSFSNPVTINDDGLLTSHRFDSLKVAKSGTIFMSWIDKRDNFKADKNGVFTKKKGNNLNGAIYTSFSIDSGQTFSKNSRLALSSCVCCRIAMTATSDNAMAIAWRHVYPGSHRDHAFAVIDTDGIKLAPNRVSMDNWKIDACPHHGPSMTEDLNSKLHLVWFTASNTRKGIYYGRLNSKSDEPDNLFNLSKVASASHPYIQIHKNELLIVWKEFDGKKTQIIKVSSDDFGKSWSTKMVISETTGESDHPFLISNKQQVWLAWLTEKEGMKFTSIES